MYPSIPQDMPLSKQTPPAFLACGAMIACRSHRGLPELYVAMKTGGSDSGDPRIFRSRSWFGIRGTNAGGVTKWPDLFLDWLMSGGFVEHR